MRFLHLPFSTLYKGNVKWFRFYSSICPPAQFTKCHLENKSCWKCGTFLHPSQSLFCNQKCGVIQPVDLSASYYSVLLPGLYLVGNSSFDLDMKELRDKYLSLQRSIHPDNYSLKDPKQKQYAEEQSTFVNKAYNILKDPLTRAIYLLQLQGITISEEDATPSELLEPLMLAWEELEEASSSPKDLEAFSLKNDAEISNVISHISKAFKEKNLESAKMHTIHLKFLYSIRNKLINHCLFSILSIT